jgi:protein-tyrosine-phosphatase
MPPRESERSYFEIRFVCTANRIRSPIADSFVRKLTAGMPVRSGSVGIMDVGSRRALPEAVAAASALELDISSHLARCLRLGELANIDLVVGFEPIHVAAAVVDGRSAPERTFLVRELVELLDAVEIADLPDPVERARQAVAAAEAQRRRLGKPSSTAASFADPLGQSPSVYRASAVELGELSARLVRRLFG